jgi:hypothetical protein
MACNPHDALATEVGFGVVRAFAVGGRLGEVAREGRGPELPGARSYNVCVSTISRLEG